MYGYIYKTTNLLNDKIYIGKKKGEFTEKYKGSGKYLKNAINKYGIENFIVEIIEYCETLEEQNEKEKYWITYYRNQNVEMYNISDGGDGGNTFAELADIDRQKRIQKLKENSYFANLTSEQQKQIHQKGWITRRQNGKDKYTIEQKQRMSNSHKGIHMKAETKQKLSKVNKGKHLTDEHKQKIGKSNKGRIRSIQTRLNMSIGRKGKCLGKDNHFYGKHHSDETKKIIGSYNKKRFENRIWINNNNENKRVLKNELETYLENGYKIGRISWKGNNNEQ